MPKKRPDYRKDRDHSSFLTKLGDYMGSVDEMEDRVRGALAESFEVVEDELTVQLGMDWSGVAAEHIAQSLGFDPADLDAKTIRTKYLDINEFHPAPAPLTVAC